ncbi:E3 ubiquitin ligase PQT3-like [Linum grandiflorum]
MIRKRSRANSYVWRRNDNNSVSIGTNSGEKRQRTTTLRPSSAAGKMVIPPEFHCPMCKRVMQDAMFVTKCCCFGTYCEGCIRGRLTTARSCACGAVDVGVDDLVPNVAIRKMIARVRAVIQSNCSSSSSDSSTVETN